MTEQELDYNLNQELRCCASGFHSIHKSRLAILALIKEAGYKSPEEVTLLCQDSATKGYAEGVNDGHNGYVKLAKDRPKIVCLCGSGRFKEAFEYAEFNETLAGNIVLTIGCNTKDIERSNDLSKLKPMLDELHLRKIDLSDEVYILDVNGYIGESTASELEYAKLHGKQIKFLSKDLDYEVIHDLHKLD